MGFWIKKIIVLAFILCIWWYISWSINPYRYCVDHPDPKLKEIYYAQCEPFDIEMKKSWRVITDPHNRGARYYDKLLEEQKKQNKRKSGQKPKDTKNIDYYK